MRKRAKNPSLRKNQDGDTLISVILSIAVVTLVIVIALVMITKSLRLSQLAKEREQVSKLVQGQIEGIKYLAFQDDQGRIFEDFEKIPGGAPDGFCLGSKEIIPPAPDPAPNIKIGVLKLDTAGEPIVPMPGDLTASDLSRGVTECEKFENLDIANVKIKITYDKTGSGASGIDEDLFTVTAVWDRVGSGDVQNEKMVIPIRIHPLRENP